MTRWARGEAEVEDLLRRRELEAITGAAADGAPLLAQQGLRATTSGGHYAVERAVRAQFGECFRPFADLRRRRNELEYPRLPSDTATADEAEEAIQAAQRLITAADQLLSQVSFFT